MIVYRLARQQYARDLSGKGAERYSGRWNSQGTPMLYTSESRALCTVEIAVRTLLGSQPEDYNIVEIELPENDIQILDPLILPPNWKMNPPGKETQKIGDEFILRGAHLIFKVPSAVVEGDFNYLINPSHPKASEIIITAMKPYNFDSRLFK